MLAAARARASAAAGGGAAGAAAAAPVDMEARTKEAMEVSQAASAFSRRSLVLALWLMNIEGSLLCAGESGWMALSEGPSALRRDSRYVGRFS